MAVTRRVLLERIERGDQGSFGRARVEGGDGRAFFTGELPWRDNRSMVSSIPAGEYHVIWAYSPHFKRYTYRLVGVPDRAGVLIHPATFMGDSAMGYRCQLNGCIALAERLGHVEGQKALLVSKPAVSALEALLERQPFQLEIRDA